MKNIHRPKHDRSLSLDYDNESLNNSCLPNRMSFFQSSKKQSISHMTSKSALNSHKKIRKTHLQKNDYLNNELRDLNAYSDDVSPEKKKHMISFLNMSQSSSALRSINALLPNSSSKKDSFSTAIDNAIINQQEKERNLYENRLKIKNETDYAKAQVNCLENKLINLQKHFSSRQFGIIDGLKRLLIQTGSYTNETNHEVVCSESQRIEEFLLLSKRGEELSDREIKELVKIIQTMNQNLFKDLAHLEKVVISDQAHMHLQLDKASFSTIIDHNHEIIKSINDNKRILIHQIYDIEDQTKELKETKMMLAEDFHSNVQQLTECVAWQEDIENYLAYLHAKNPEFFDRLQKEIINAEEQILLLYNVKELENDLLKTQEIQQKKQLDHFELIKEFEEEEQQFNCYDQMKTLILEDIFKREKTIFYLFYKSFYAFREQYNLQQLFSYLKLFDINLQALQQESCQSVSLLMNYHFLMLKEIAEVLKFQRDTESIEKRLVELRTKAKNGEDTGIISTLQNEGIARRNQIKEYNAKIQEQKEQLYLNSQSHRNIQELLKDHITNSFVKIWQELNSRVENDELIDEMLLSLLLLAQQKRDNYQAYFDLEKSVDIKQNQLNQWKKSLENQKEELDILQIQIYKHETQVNEIHEKVKILKIEQKNIEDSYTQISLKERERMYSSYLADNDGYFKKIKFQLGKNYLTKMQQNILEDFTNVANINFSNRKAQVAELNFVLRRLEKQCESYNLRINQISSEFKQVESALHDSGTKINTLNKDLMDLIEQEKGIEGLCNEKMQERRFSIDIEPRKKFQESFENIQHYKIKISQIIQQIVYQVVVFKHIHKDDYNPPPQPQKLVDEFKKLQREIRMINEHDLKQITIFCDEISKLKTKILEKQERLNVIDKQLNNSGKIHNITQFILKEKADLANGFGTTMSSEKKLDQSNDASIFLGSSGHKSIKLVSDSLCTGSYSPFSRENRNLDKLNNTESKTAFPDSLVKPRDRSKREKSQIHSSVQKELSISSELNTQRHLVSTDLSSSRSLLRDNSGSLNYKQSVRSSVRATRKIQNNISCSKSPKRTHLSIYSHSNVMDEHEINDENSQSNSKASGNKKLDVEAYLCLQEPEYIEKSINALEEGIILYKKFSSNNDLALKQAGANTTGHRRGNSLSKAISETEPKGYGKRLIKLNKRTKTIEIYKFKQFSDKTTLEYYYEFKYLEKVFYPAILTDILKKIRNQQNKENQKVMTRVPSCFIQNKSQENLLPFGIDVQNRGRVEFLIGDLESLKQISTCITFIIKVKPI